MRRWFAVPLILVLLPLLALHWVLDPAALKLRASEAVRRDTGRELTIAGPLTLAWTPLPHIRAEDLRLANPPGLSRPDMATARAIEAGVALWPLLSGDIRLTGVTVLNPDVQLEGDAAGQPNWRFDPGTPAAQRRALEVDGWAVTGGRIGWQADGRLVEVLVPSLAGKGAGVSGQIVWAGQPVAVSGSLDAVRMAGLGADVTLRGLPDAPALSGVIADLAPLSPVAGVALPALLDVHVAAEWGKPGHIEMSAKWGGAPATFAARIVSAAGGVALRGVTLTAAAGDLAGDVALDWRGRPSLRGSLVSHHLDWAALMAALRHPEAAPRPASADDTGWTLQAPLPFGAMTRGDLDLEIRADEVVVPTGAVHAVQGRVRLQDGRLRLEPFQMQAAGGTAKIHAEADANPPRAALVVLAPGLSPGRLSALSGWARVVNEGAVDVDVSLQGEGGTGHALAATAAGHFAVALTQGQIDGWTLRLLAGGLIAGPALPAQFLKQTAVRCLAIRADVAGGEAVFRTLVLDTQPLKLTGNGLIDLGAETIDVRLHVLTALGGAGVALPIHLDGAWQAPRVRSESGQGRSGIAIGAVPERDACPAALLSARDGRAGPVPDAVAPKPANVLRSLLR